MCVMQQINKTKNERSAKANIGKVVVLSVRSIVFIHKSLTLIVLHARVRGEPSKRLRTAQNIKRFSILDLLRYYCLMFMLLHCRVAFSFIASVRNEI